MLRTFIHEANKYEQQVWQDHDEDTTLAVKKLIPESLLSYRFRGTTMTYDELITARENVIFDEVMTVPLWKPRKTDTISSMNGEVVSPSHMCFPVLRHQKSEFHFTLSFSPSLLRLLSFFVFVFFSLFLLYLSSFLKRNIFPLFRFFFFPFFVLPRDLCES